EASLVKALEEYGIGRPSTRAAIIKTLFQRDYIRRQRKALIATQTGVELIGIIKEELLKSAELTGIWERKLRLIEQRKYSATQFIDELKQMVADIVRQVLADNENRRLTVDAAAANDDGLPPVLKRVRQQEAAAEVRPRRKVLRAGSVCPECGRGKVIKGKTAYGCSRWKEGCAFRKPFKK
ncbi:MAG TPA: DNA topoisomerase, partial [Alloprevotella sp.]|nr:DNA topoisomerase [Alloprevotella sp.]